MARIYQRDGKKDIYWYLDYVVDSRSSAEVPADSA